MNYERAMKRVIEETKNSWTKLKLESIFHNYHIVSVDSCGEMSFDFDTGVLKNSDFGWKKRVSYIDKNGKKQDFFFDPNKKPN